MAYFIFGDAFTFPDGDASTNRVIAYAKGFQEVGVDVRVICFRKSYLANPDGKTEGINYYHPFRRSKRSRSFIIRRFHDLGKYYRTYRLFKDYSGKGEKNVVLCYSKLLRTQIFSFFLSRLINANLILERSEHPLKDYQSRFVAKTFGLLKVRLEIKFSDAIFCISDYLIRFYSKRGAKRGRLLKVTSTVVGDRFKGPFQRPVPFKYICYSGSLTRLKDGVDILISSFSKISARFPEVNLVLVGKADTNEDELFFRDLVSSLSLSERVMFTGKLARNAVPPYLSNAEVLALARPRSIVADAGFPSKVSEYLATGKPVVATVVGEIPEFLTDKVSAFLSEPDNVDAFAEKLAYVMNNYVFACEVGLRGKELVAGVFNYNYQASRAVDFIQSL